MSEKLNYKPCIITVALTGNVTSKKMNKNVPITPDEIVKDIIQCYKAGASVFHIHVRDLISEKPSQNLDLYREVVRMLKRKVPDVIIQLTTGGRCGKDDYLRMDVVRLCPEMASFTTGSNNLAKIIYENSPQFILKLAKTFHDCQVKPEVECFDTGHIDNAIYLCNKKKLLKYPLHFNFVLGTNGGCSGDVDQLNYMRKKIPNDCTWSACGIGYSQFRIVLAAIAMGGNVRVGLEDMIYMPDESLASNLKLVKKVVRLCKEFNRNIATPAEAREILSLDVKKKDRIVKYLNRNIPIHKVDYSILKGDLKLPDNLLKNELLEENKELKLKNIALEEKLKNLSTKKSFITSKKTLYSLMGILIGSLFLLKFKK